MVKDNTARSASSRSIWVMVSHSMLHSGGLGGRDTGVNLDIIMYMKFRHPPSQRPYLSSILRRGISCSLATTEVWLLGMVDPPGISPTPRSITTKVSNHVFTWPVIQLRRTLQCHAEKHSDTFIIYDFPSGGYVCRDLVDPPSKTAPPPPDLRRNSRNKVSTR